MPHTASSFYLMLGTFGGLMSGNWQSQRGGHVGYSIRSWQTANRPFPTRLASLLVTEVMKMQNQGHPHRLSCISSLLPAGVATFPHPLSTDRPTAFPLPVSHLELDLGFIGQLGSSCSYQQQLLGQIV